MLTKEEKLAKKETKSKAKQEAKELARINAEKNQKPVKWLKIIIEWKQSRTWGYCPRAYAEVSFKDNDFIRTENKYYASGCGYDKESTVIAEIFNEFLKYKLWLLTPEQRKGGNGSNDNGKAPYGIHVYSENNPHYGGGIGTNCYYDISKYIGGKFECLASGKTFDVYKYTDNE